MTPLSFNEYTITNVFEFAKDIQHFEIGDYNFLVSYDVTALFKIVPLDETIHVLAIIGSTILIS